MHAENFNKDDFVRGKRRQRKKAPKTRTGCATCKIRRIKCDETKPSCERCTSTGRKCDGYDLTLSATKSPTRIENGAELSPVARDHSSSSEPEVPGSDTMAVVSKRQRYEATNQVAPSVLFTSLRDSPIPLHMARAFDYFLSCTSIDLASPVCTQIWGQYVLGVSISSPAVQHGVTALSGFHELYTSPKYLRSTSRQADCWKHYYLAVKMTNVAVSAAADGIQIDPARSSSEEILIASAIFITIEVLLGNLEAAVRHLQGAFSLIQAYFSRAKSLQMCGPEPPPMKLLQQQKGRKKATSNSNTSDSHLDQHLADLIGFFARLDLQLLSFLPPGRYPLNRTATPPTSATPQLDQPLPNPISASLYRIIRQCLYWIRHHVTPFKRSPTIPSSLYEAQTGFLSTLQEWLDMQFEDWSQSPGSDSTLSTQSTDPEVANLLLAYHLTYLKVQTALSQDESIFLTPQSLTGFTSIVDYAQIILDARNGHRPEFTERAGNFGQLASFFSLEMSTVEALYFTAVKCRDTQLRYRAVEMLKIAGREGIWDGPIMAQICEYIIQVEQENASPTPISFFEDDLGDSIMGNFSPNHDLHFQVGSDTHEASPIREGSLIDEVKFSIDKATETAEVTCGWFRSEQRSWKHRTTILTL